MGCNYRCEERARDFNAGLAAVQARNMELARLHARKFATSIQLDVATLKKQGQARFNTTLQAMKRGVFR